MFETANVPLKYRYMFDSLEKNTVFVDCGTNVGLITDIALFVGMEVYAFEPNISAFKLLKRKYANTTNVHLYQKAVSDTNEQLTFYVNEKSLYDQGATIVSSGEKFIYEDKNSYLVDSVRLSEVLKKDILSQHKKIHLLKLDVEGAEFAIIEDLIISGVYKEISYIVCETHERFFGKAGTKKIKHLHNLIHKHHIENIFLDWI
ncbi:MAG: FkbM family methyltransferase [Candidatus Peribacteria bacterium]|jgi:FkbM family methyltransferase|nr:FkbM family methyltransferase [Candidatus Peribacteria bacterium]